MSFIIATTRFNNETFMENKRWRETNLGLGGCIYKVPIKIASSITVGIGGGGLWAVVVFIKCQLK